ncbi:hypothetical protein [Halobacillus sp. Marseille-P3879]|uniref:hypothetical protein n=1 Tax=Halobacillus sp. Marseille-P3879 TaxID=2045014 RepID=UPI000C7DD024|nr:hypothetical protein [Halobacillus sp. Marseille-P3879]
MTNVYNFEKFKSKKEIRKVTQENIVYEIYLTTVKYVLRYSIFESEDLEKPITTESSLNYLFNGSPERFSKAFNGLADYWNIDIDSTGLYPTGKEFQVFPTVGHLCIFIEGKIKYSDA